MKNENYISITISRSESMITPVWELTFILIAIVMIIKKSYGGGIFLSKKWITEILISLPLAQCRGGDLFSCPVLIQSRDCFVLWLPCLRIRHFACWYRVKGLAWNSEESRLWRYDEEPAVVCRRVRPNERAENESDTGQACGNWME